MLELGALDGRQGQQLLHDRALGHGVHELVGDDVQAVDAAFGESVQHHPHAADQVRHFRRFADVAHRRHHVSPHGAEELRRLVAHQRQLRLHVLRFPLAQAAHQFTEQVDVQAAAQAAVRGDDDVADALHVAHGHVGVVVFGRRLGQVADHVFDALAVRAALLHPILGALHARGRHHLHGAGALLRGLHAGDLLLDLAAGGHLSSLSVSLNASAMAYS